MGNSVGAIGVLDKAMAVLAAVEAEPRSLAELVSATGISRATAHRVASALEGHGMLRRDAAGRWVIGYRALALGWAAAHAVPIAEAAGPALAALREATGESVQLFVRDNDHRLCVASLESPHGLRTIVPTGARLPLHQGSGGRALSADESVIAHGFVHSVGEREPGVASVSAPVLDATGEVVAAVGVSGPIERLTRDPGSRHGTAVADAARRIERDAGLRPVA